MPVADGLPGADFLRFVRRFVRRTAVVLTISMWGATATLWAGNPRWVTGFPYFNQEGVAITWYTSRLLYFTDPGDLSTSVNHAAADALVAAAAGVWNVPSSSLVLGQGGALNEHVSEANTFASQTGVIFPADVQSSNYLAKQIAVIYDRDGSVTDLLLGNGASDPSGCRQNAVTESVDSIVPAGFIEHAVLVLNGRCTGPAPEQQLQMQYQLMRAFGRVLGLGWSQLNDNVFTGGPQPTYNQALHWPIMHPIDIICGPYTYQCLPQPFTLRPDDLSSLAALYYIPQGTAPPGKIDSLSRAHLIYGQLIFPTSQGMSGVNVIGRRWEQYTDPSQEEDWYTVSSVSGAALKRYQGNPVTAPDNSATGSMGARPGAVEGSFQLTRIPMLDGDWEDVFVETEAINPLYTGRYSVGPYLANTVAPSGTNLTQLAYVLSEYTQAYVVLPTAGGATSCYPGADGVESAPLPVVAGGWWTGRLCANLHTAWSALTVQGNRSFTLEVTAEDEQGSSTNVKAMPVLGVWNATDALGSLPGVGSVGEAFNGETTGTTTLTIHSTQPNQLRIVVADQRGNGRPDFNYQARVLYADAVSPASVPAAGGVVRVSGMGFRIGNEVLVNGVVASVASWSAGSIVATVPSLQALGAGSSLVADVTVRDLSTGATTVMTHALTYGTPVPVLKLLTAPSGSVIVAQQAGVPFAVQALAADGVTPIPGQPIVFIANGGPVLFGACGAGSCTVSTNALGVASTTVTPLTTGSITLSAVGLAGTQSATIAAIAQVRAATLEQATVYVAEGATFVSSPQLVVMDNSASTLGVPVLWQTVSGPVVFSPGLSQVSVQGLAQTLATIGPLAGGAVASASACVWASVCATLVAEGVSAANLRLGVVAGGGQTIRADGTFTPLTLMVTDTASHPVAGAVVQIYQTVEALEPDCPDRGRCPIAPVYASSAASLTSDGEGLITVVPEEIRGTATVTNIAAATGTQGFVSLQLQKMP